MPLRFPMLLGSHRDAVELNYIASLLQTTSDKSYRADGTISALDVRRHLTSRHGFRVDTEVLENQVLYTLAGTRPTTTHPPPPQKGTKFNARKVRYHGGPVQQQQQQEDDMPRQQDAYMDLCQLAGLILAPELVHLQRQHEEKNATVHENPLALMELLLDVMVEELAFVTPPDELKKMIIDDHEKGGRAILLDRQTLVRLFRAVGEEPSHWTRQDLDQMLQMASGQDKTPKQAVRLDATALLRALTTDVMLYPVERTQEVSTHYEDVMCTVKDRQEQKQEETNNDKVDSNQDENNNSLKQQSAETETEEAGPSPTLDTEKGRPTKCLIAAKSKSALMDALRPPLRLGTSEERIFTLASLDQAADTQKSLVWAVLSWVTLVATAFAYFLGTYEEEFDYQTNLPNLDCSSPDAYSFSEFGCKILNGIILWTQVFIEMSLVGGSFMILSQLGNNVYTSDCSRVSTVLYSLVGIATVTIVCILSYFYDVDTIFFDTNRERNAIHVVTFLLGTLLVLIQAMELVRLFLPIERFAGRLRRICSPDAYKREQSTKHAASFKTCRMITNAVGCFLGDKFDQHDEIEEDASMRSTSHSNPKDRNPIIEENEIFRDVRAPLVKRLSALVHEINERQRRDAADGIVKRSGGLQAGAFVYYNDHMDETVMTGSICYFWGNLFGSRSMIREEGLWLSVRLITANFAQWVVAIAVIPSLFYVLYSLNEENEDVDKIQEEENIEDSDAIPGIFVGGIAAILVTWLTALIYIPMALSTVLQMRSGYLGNFYGPSFQLFRKSTDRATALFGSALWGSLFSAALAWGIVGGIIFVFLWEDIRAEVLDFTAGAIGFATTFAIKWLGVKIFRGFYFGALYRKKPAAANIFHLVLECWNIALSSGFMLLRIGRLLLCTVFYLGRNDTPLFADGVGLVFNSPLDNYPMAFRRDLAVHEAHRHPWIERLATMYMMKLQHGSLFGQRGGAAWRIIFVFTLLPWLRKHRQMAPIYIDEAEDVESIVDDVDIEVYGVDEDPERIPSSLRLMQERRSSRMGSQTALHLLAENDSLVAKNLALQREVAELRSLLGRERRRSTVRARAVSSRSIYATPDDPSSTYN